MASDDRDEFGAWLTGFADSRAAFMTREDGPDSPVLLFRIDRDEVDVVERIRDYWGIDIEYRFPTARIQDLQDIMTVVLPHFRRHPLWLPSQLREFERWREDVEAAVSL